MLSRGLTLGSGQPNDPFVVNPKKFNETDKIDFTNNRTPNDEKKCSSK
jgi:hypothetical protein